MFLHPVDYGRKAEELLWRKVYYEVIQVIKTNKKVNGPATVGENPLCISALSALSPPPPPTCHLNVNPSVRTSTV